MKRAHPKASPLPAGEAHASARAASDRNANQVRRPFRDQPLDYPERIRLVEPVNLYDLRVEQLKFEREQPSRAERLATIFCLAAAAWAIVYFAVQMLRGWLS